MPLGGRKKIAPFVEVNNVMNHRPETAVLERATDRYGSPAPEGRYASATDYQVRRNFRFGVKFSF